MATFEKRKHGWLVRVQKLGVRESKTFDNKEEGAAWAKSGKLKLPGWENLKERSPKPKGKRSLSGSVLSGISSK